MRCALSFALLSSLLAAAACNKDEAAAQSAPEAEKLPELPEVDDRLAGEAAEPAGDDDKHMVALGAGGKSKVVAVGGKTIADTPTYTVTLAAPPKVNKGTAATATLEILPKEGWKLNKEFPTKLTVNQPAGVKVKKPEQTVADAVSFADKSGKWSVEFQAESAGGKDFTGQIKFAVCTETSCDPKKEQLAFSVAVAE